MITVQTTINNSIEKVWDSYTNTNHVIHWNFASDDWHCPQASNELKVGSPFNYEMASKDGSMSFNFTGVFTEIDVYKTIQYTMDDGRKAILNFKETEQGVEVIEQFEPEKMNTEELQRFGWQSILDNFKKYTETL